MWDAEISIIDRCSSQRLRNLLALAAADAKTDRERILLVGERIRMEGLLEQMSRGAAPGGADLVRIACSPETPIEQLIAAKSIAKRFAAAAESVDERAAATLLYHLVVGAALAFHGRNISSHDPATRLALYEDLAAELFDDELGGVFAKAIATMSSGSD